MFPRWIGISLSDPSRFCLPIVELTEIFQNRAHVNEKGEWIWKLEDSQTSMAEQALEMGAEYILYHRRR